LISLCSQNAEFRGFEGFQRLKRFAKRFLEFRVQKVFLMTTAKTVMAGLNNKPGHDANESRSYHSFRFSGSHFPKFLTVPGMPPYFPDRRAISPRTSSRQPPPSQPQTLP